MIFSFFHIWLASVEFRREKSSTWHVASNFLKTSVFGGCLCYVYVILHNMMTPLFSIILSMRHNNMVFFVRHYSMNCLCVSEVRHNNGDENGMNLFWSFYFTVYLATYL